jgi:hypothetical protein
MTTVYTLFIAIMQSSTLPTSRLDHGLLHLRCLYRKVLQGKPNKMFHVKGLLRTFLTVQYEITLPESGSAIDSNPH